ncbi:OmpA family protein [uncultured Flavobacterium sp.]|jgi:outer membrane protein OmpA-like peptidoglycan-associated protein|uniref:OmpA family protein n=1 Tax=uncultured Flavobacterium sp. TaxID=165435 RepID=UPI0025989B18|nr:OmpA family protein [uncultured Flavobacterium sp.]
MQFLYSTTFLFLTFFGFSQETFSVYFDSDKYDLTSLESLRLQDWINKNSKSKILSMEGFTDEVGTTSYNDTLSLKRVAFVYNQIHNKIAVREDFRSNGFGEIRQISNNREENRRVTIYYLSEFQISLEEFIINDFQVQKLLDLLVIKEVEKININPKWTLAEVVEKVPIGTMFTLENIQFHFDSADLMLNANQELDKWLVVLNSNPDLKIIVQGHICCIHKDDILLSSKRARAVLDYLVSKGVEKERIHYVGYGSSRPKFKIPEKNGYEALMNRRVEIVIQEK